MKKKFILFLGISWSGTTSLYNTLKYKCNYMHGGWEKESRTLSRIFYPTQVSKLKHRTYFDLLFDSMNYISNNMDTKDPVLLKFTEKELNFYFGPNISLKKYVQHYVKLAEYCGNDYQAVGDFSNRNFDLQNNMLEEIKSALSQYFDVKIIFIFRDFIRKQWSEICALTNGKYFRKEYDTTNSSVADIFRSIACPNYTQKIKDVYHIFGKENICYLIMEDFFKEDNKTEVSKLEQFLNINIPEVAPCVFVPDKGINPSKLEGLIDQWSSDTEILTPEFYTKMRNRKDYDKIYSEFKELHGSLPADWGSPIDYGY